MQFDIPCVQTKSVSVLLVMMMMTTVIFFCWGLFHYKVVLLLTQNNLLPSEIPIHSIFCYVLLYMYSYTICCLVKQAVRRSPPTAGVKIRVSVTPCKFRFPRGFSRFPLPKNFILSFLQTLFIHFISFHQPCDSETGVVGRHPCYSLTTLK